MGIEDGFPPTVTFVVLMIRLSALKVTLKKFLV